MGCTLLITSSGATISPFENLLGTASGGTLSTPPPENRNADMSLVVSSGAVVVNTTLPADAGQVYDAFIQSKYQCMTSGGTVVWGGNALTFDAGYAGISSSSLMSLNGVRYQDNCDTNVNICPSVGAWVEPGWESDLAIGIDPGCVTCRTYTDLMVLEMILYHAINRIAWKIMRDIKPYGWTPGLWRQYQSLLDRWNSYAFSTSYVSYVNSVREAMTATIGWCNPTCDVHGFTAWTTITGTISTPAQYAKYRLFYMGSFINSADKSHGNNLDIRGAAVFIIHGSKYFLKGDAGVPPNGPTFPAEQINDIDQFSQELAATPWTLGVYVPQSTGVTGLGYVAQAFGTGLSIPRDDEDAYEIDTSRTDSYTAVSYWQDTLLNQRVTGPTKTLTVYGLKAQDVQ